MNEANACFMQIKGRSSSSFKEGNQVLNSNTKQEEGTTKNWSTKGYLYNGSIKDCENPYAE